MMGIMVGFLIHVSQELQEQFQYFWLTAFSLDNRDTNRKLLTMKRANYSIIDI